VRAGHPPGAFGHREHLRLAWLALDQEPDVGAATEYVSAAVLAIAIRHGQQQRYNRTVTEAWVRVVAHCRGQIPFGTFDDLLAERPWLFDKRLLVRHYSSRVLASAAARITAVDPDLHPIPA
jgi:hypothetical protein